MAPDDARDLPAPVARFIEAAEMLGWRRFGPAWSPGRIVVTWADEPGPWYITRMERVELDADVRDALQRARVVLARATS